MNFKDALKTLVTRYATYDDESKCYIDKQPFTIEEKQKIEAMLIALISQYLSQAGLDQKAKARLEIYSKELQKYFHPDKYLISHPENKWLQRTLYPAETTPGATCFNLVRLCEEKLKNPALPEFHFEGISTMESLVQRLERDRERAITYTQRALLDSTLTLLKSAEAYNGQVDKKIPIVWAKRLTQLTPYLTTGYCLSFFLKDLALLYAVTFTLTKTGRWLEHSNARTIEMMGQVMHTFSSTIFSAITALIAKLTELNIFVVQGAVNVSVDASMGLYQLLVTPKMYDDATFDSHDLALVPQDLLGGLRFNSLEFKTLAMGLEEQANQLKGQWLLNWRTGSLKYTAILETLRALEKIDRTELALSLKLNEAEKIIKGLSCNQTVNVYGSATHQAIQVTQRLLLKLKRQDSDEPIMLLTDSDDKMSIFEP